MARFPSPRLGLGPFFAGGSGRLTPRGFSLWRFMAGSAANVIAWAAPLADGRGGPSLHNQKFHEFMNAT